VTDN
jgi:hypothetical protein